MIKKCVFFIYFKYNLVLEFFIFFKLLINDGTIINDAPRFKYRGLMLDTARHFIPVPVLRKQIDAMSYNKFNVFHW